MKDLSNPPWTWQRSGSPFTQKIVTDLIKDEYTGFVYLITRIKDGKFYVGKKLLRFKKRVKSKGKRARISYVESDWKTYWGSSKELQADVEKLGTAAFKREIISVCKGKQILSYYELLCQIERNVMIPETNSYNQIINVRLRIHRK